MDSKLVKALSIIHVNIEGITPASKFLLSQHILKYKPHIVTVNETHLKPHRNVPNIPDYTLIRNDRPGTRMKGGVAMYIHTNLPFQVETVAANPSENEFLTCKIAINQNECIYISTIYVPSRVCPPDPIIFDSILNQRPKHIITGDFNAHHIHYGSTKTDTEGRALMDIIDTNNLVMLNDRSHTLHIRNPRPNSLGTELVDYVLATPDIGHRLINYEILDLVSNDHYPSLTTIRINTVSVDTQPKVIVQIKKLKVDNYKSELSHNIEPPRNLLNKPHKIDEYINYLTKQINTATINNTPTILIKPGAWTPSLETMSLIQKKRNLVRKRNRTHDQQLNPEINRLTNKIKLLIAEERVESWQNLCSTALKDPKKHAHKFWKNFKKLTGCNKKPENYILKHGNDIANTPQQKSELQAKYYSNQMKPTPEDPLNQAWVQEANQYIAENPNIFSPRDDINSHEDIRPLEHELVKAITEDEIKNIIKHLPDKAPGPDLIHNASLKHSPPMLIQCLAIVFNSCIQIGYFPKTWKKAIIQPILKPHKPKHDPKSYRPISLLSTVGKLFEQIINHRLKDFLEHHNLLNPDQCGFRPGKATTDQLLKFTQHVAQARVRGRIKAKTLAIFIDIEAAFDKVWHNGLLYKLQRLGLPDELTRLLASYLRDRKLSVKFGETFSDIYNIEAGVPQGAVLSPLLFNIYINDIPKANRDIKISQFADDIVIWTSHKNPDLAGTNLQNYLDQLSNWCNKWRITLNPAKSTLLYISHQQNTRPNMHINGTQIDYSTSTNFLGLTINNTLTWHNHIDKIKQRCNARLNLLRKISGTSWGASPKTIIHTYNALIFPVLNYAYPAWNNLPKTHIQTLQTIQNKMLRIAYRVSPLAFISNEILHDRANIPLVKDKCIQQAKDYLSKRRATNSNPQLTEIIDTFRQLVPYHRKQVKSPLHNLLPLNNDIQHIQR